MPAHGDGPKPGQYPCERQICGHARYYHAEGILVRLRLRRARCSLCRCRSFLRTG